MDDGYLYYDGVSIFHDVPFDERSNERVNGDQEFPHLSAFLHAYTSLPLVKEEERSVEEVLPTIVNTDLFESTSTSDSIIPTRDETGRIRCVAEGCSKSYLWRNDMKYHAKLAHPDDPNVVKLILTTSKSSQYKKPCICPVSGCKSGFKRFRDLDRHVRKEHNSPPTRRYTRLNANKYTFHDYIPRDPPGEQPKYIFHSYSPKIRSTEEAS